MKTYKPDASSLHTLRLLIILISAVLIILIKLFIVIELLSFILIIVSAVVCAAFALFYLPMYFSRLSYQAGETEISKESGVFFRKSQTIKYSSIQYSGFITMPFSRTTGFNFIIFYVYGGRQVLLFLKKKDAEEILKLSGCPYGRED